jgi:hypothetical protein
VRKWFVLFGVLAAAVAVFFFAAAADFEQMDVALRD